MELKDIEIRVNKTDAYGENHIDGSTLYALMYEKLQSDIDKLVQNKLSEISKLVKQHSNHIDEIYDLLKQINHKYGENIDQDLEYIKNKVEELKKQIDNPSYLKLIMNSNMEQSVDNNTIWINDQGEVKCKINNEIKKLA